MKRFTAASVAAATALSLVAMPAQAAEKKSSEVSDLEAGAYVLEGIGKEVVKKGSGLTPSMRSIFKNYEKGDDVSALESSLRNDAANGYKVGTTFDILLGTGITALLLALIGGAAAYQGLIPGVQL
ncbi:hypothetical protein [Corynebacterium riegelii]